jgi:hypothetical protein
MKPADFIGEKVIYDSVGQIIFAQTGDDLQLLLNVRGWGAIQNLSEFKDSEQKAGKFQDELGEWIAEAINERIQKEQY